MATEGQVLKTSIVLEIKPWGDDTDMAALEAGVRSIAVDTLIWGEGKLVPVGYGLSKLMICAVVESEKADCDLLVEQIEQLDDFVQSVEVIQFKSTSTFFHNRLE